jgi:hypothetical protein
MPLYAVLVREYFGVRIMGSMFGAVSAFASLGMAWARSPRMGVRHLPRLQLALCRLVRHRIAPSPWH